MKKRISFTIMMILLVVSGSFVFTKKNEKHFKIEGQPNLDIMLSYNGENLNYFPEKNANLYYNVQIDCDNADAKWDYENWEMVVTDLKEDTASCKINFTSSAKKSLYKKIESDWNETDGTKNIYKEVHTFSDGTEYFEYRYEGTDDQVENYVLFNNEMWRIIGAFPGGTPTTGTTSATFAQGDGAPSVNDTVKIIRNDAIGSHVWAESSNNDWSAAALNTSFLNDRYLESGEHNYCSFYSTTVYYWCVYSGLADISNYIEEVTWNLGSSSSAGNPQAMYLNERGKTVYSGRPYVHVAKVGLMYPSDYGYSTSDETCQTGTNLSAYGACGAKGWLLKNGYEWFITHRSGASGTSFALTGTGVVTATTTTYGYLFTPVVFLKNNVYVVGGDGGINNPFVLELIEETEE